MSKDLDALRKQFFSDDSEDPFAFAAEGSSSTAVASPGPSRARQAQGARSSRAAPYPNRTGRTSGGRSFADDPLGGLGLGRPPAVDALAMDIDDVHGRDRNADEVNTLDAREEAALEIEREEMDGITGGGGGGSDVQKLLRAWQAERHAPTILPAEGELLGRVLDAIIQQVRSTLQFPAFYSRADVPCCTFSQYVLRYMLVRHLFRLLYGYAEFRRRGIARGGRLIGGRALSDDVGPDRS